MPQSGRRFQGASFQGGRGSGRAANLNWDGEAPASRKSELGGRGGEAPAEPRLRLKLELSMRPSQFAKNQAPVTVPAIRER